MAVWRVEVDVATARPPQVHATAYFLLVAPNWREAEQDAIAMVMVSRPQVVMAVGTRSERVPDPGEPED